MKSTSARDEGNRFIITKDGEEYVFEHKTIKVNDAIAFYTEIGSGEKTILMLQGFPAPWCICWEMDTLLSKHFKLIILELPGYLGTKGNPGFIHTHQNFANFVYSFINVFGISPNYVMGESYGGKITLELARNHPELFEKIVLHSPEYAKPKIPLALKIITYSLYPLLKIGFVNKILNPILIKIFLKFGAQFVVKGYKLESMDELTMQMLVDSVKNAELKPLCETMIDVLKPLDQTGLNRIKKETLVISGNADESVDIKDSINLAENILLNAKFVGISEFGHWLPVVKPELTSEIIVNFLNSTP